MTIGEVHKRSYHEHAHFDGPTAIQNAGCHQTSVFSKNIRQRPGKLEPLQVVAICDHLSVELRLVDRNRDCRALDRSWSDRNRVPVNGPGVLFSGHHSSFRNEEVELTGSSMRAWLRAIAMVARKAHTCA